MEFEESVKTPSQNNYNDKYESDSQYSDEYTNNNIIYQNDINLVKLNKFGVHKYSDQKSR
jgi:hypothetical protein